VADAIPIRLRDCRAFVRVVPMFVRIQLGTVKLVAPAGAMQRKAVEVLVGTS
jgi:hypothetical protein